MAFGADRGYKVNIEIASKQKVNSCGVTLADAVLAEQGWWLLFVVVYVRGSKG